MERLDALDKIQEILNRKDKALQDAERKKYRELCVEYHLAYLLLELSRLAEMCKDDNEIVKSLEKLECFKIFMQEVNTIYTLAKK